MTDVENPRRKSGKGTILLAIVVLALCAGAVFFYLGDGDSAGGRQVSSGRGGSGGSTQKTVVLGGQNFLRTIDSGVHLVDFWAEWCGPCRTQGPIVEQLAQDFSGKAGIGKIDVDAEPEISQAFAIHSIPTLILFKDGKEVSRFVGVTSREELAKAVNAAL